MKKIKHSISRWINNNLSLLIFSQAMCGIISVCFLYLYVDKQDTSPFVNIMVAIFRAMHWTYAMLVLIVMVPVMELIGGRKPFSKRIKFYLFIFVLFNMTWGYLVDTGDVLNRLSLVMVNSICIFNMLKDKFSAEDNNTVIIDNSQRSNEERRVRVGNQRTF
jgi:hypothetical protein